MRENIVNKSIVGLILLIALIGFIAGIAGSAVVYSFVFSKQLDEFTNKSQTIVKKIIQLQDNSIIDVVEKTTPSVVNIVATKDVLQQQRMFSPFNFFFSPNQQIPQGSGEAKKQKVGGGTGFFVSADGMIVTNRHVVVDTDAEYTVITSDGQEFVASVLARDDILDFAVLKIEGEGFTAATLGKSDDIKIGQTVIAIGNSLGEFSHSVSRGIISGVGRDIVAGGGLSGRPERLTNIIQTDAAINPGNSGGPLLDLDGRVIGINTAIAQGAQNIGFAIPIGQVMNLIIDVKEDGKISHPFLGIRYVEINEEIKNELNVPSDNGVLIIRGENIIDFPVLPGSPADKAGLIEYDVILEIDGKEITREKPLAHMISEYKIGDEITLTVWSKGEKKSVNIKLEDKTQSDE